MIFFWLQVEKKVWHVSFKKHVFKENDSLELVSDNFVGAIGYLRLLRNQSYVISIALL